AKSISGITLTDADSNGETLTLVVRDAGGLLSATAGGSATVSGSGTTQLTIMGDLTAISSTLQTLSVPENAFGNDTNDLAVSDERGGSDYAHITVSCNAAPVAKDIFSSIAAGQSADIPILRFVRDVDGDPLTVQVKTGPANGSIDVLKDGSLQYTPN